MLASATGFPTSVPSGFDFGRQDAFVPKTAVRAAVRSTLFSSMCSVSLRRLSSQCSALPDSNLVFSRMFMASASLNVSNHNWICLWSRSFGSKSMDPEILPTRTSFNRGLSSKSSWARSCLSAGTHLVAPSSARDVVSIGTLVWLPLFIHGDLITSATSSQVGSTVFGSRRNLMILSRSSRLSGTGFFFEPTRRFITVSTMR